MPQVRLLNLGLGGSSDFVLSRSSDILRNHSPALITVQPSFSTIHCKTLSQTLLACYPSACLPSSILAGLLSRADLRFLSISCLTAVHGLANPIPALLPCASKGAARALPLSLAGACEPVRTFQFLVGHRPLPIRSFNRRSRPCRDCRLSTSSAPLPHIHKSLPTPALSPLSATLMGSPRMCCKQKTYSNAKPFRCNIYAKPGGGAFFPFWNYSSAVTEHGSRITHRRPAPILSGSPVMRSSVKAILLLFLHKTYNLQLKTETSLRVQRLQLGIHQERIIELRHFTPALAQNRKEARRKRFVPFHG